MSEDPIQEARYEGTMNAINKQTEKVATMISDMATGIEKYDPIRLSSTIVNARQELERLKSMVDNAVKEQVKGDNPSNDVMQQIAKQVDKLTLELEAMSRSTDYRKTKPEEDEDDYPAPGKKSNVVHTTKPSMLGERTLHGEKPSEYPYLEDKKPVKKWMTSTVDPLVPKDRDQEASQTMPLQTGDSGRTKGTSKIIETNAEEVSWGDADESPEANHGLRLNIAGNARPQTTGQRGFHADIEEGQAEKVNTADETELPVASEEEVQKARQMAEDSKRVLSEKPDKKKPDVYPYPAEKNMVEATKEIIAICESSRDPKSMTKAVARGCFLVGMTPPDYILRKLDMGEIEACLSETREIAQNEELLSQNLIRKEYPEDKAIEPETYYNLSPRKRTYIGLIAKTVDQPLSLRDFSRMSWKQIHEMASGNTL